MTIPAAHIFTCPDARCPDLCRDCGGYGRVCTGVHEPCGGCEICETCEGTGVKKAPGSDPEAHNQRSTK